jgi:hypothetical protein
MGEMRNAYEAFVGKLEGKRHSQDLGIDGRIILEGLLVKRMEKCGLDSSGSGWQPVAGSL